MSGASAAMLANTCFGCHGVNGVSAGPAIPSIAGMSAAYMTEVLQGYKSGEVSGTIMDRIAKGYSDEEIKQVSEVYAKQTAVKAAGQTVDTAAAEKGKKLHEKYCEKCHSESGTVADDDSGFLGGQWAPYLQATLTDFHAGKREMPKKMKKKMEDLMKKEGDEGVTALVNYYASQQ
jgi:sulfide dehydrogenase cytochrome subunit